MARQGALTGAELTDLVCAEVVRLGHVRIRTDLAHDQELYLLGQIKGLRVSLCLLKGWDPIMESGKEEQADRFVTVWHNLPGHCGRDGCGPW